MMIFLRSAVIGAAAFLLAGCAGGNAPATPTSPTSSAPSDAGGAGSAGAALPLQQRVVPGDLAGLKSSAGVKSASTPDAYVDLQIDHTDSEYAQQRATDLGLLRDKGFVTGAVKVYGDSNSPGNGLSTVAQLSSPEQAKAYEQALYQDEFGTDLPPSAIKGTIAGAATSNTVTDKETEDGGTSSRGWAAFTDGPFVYVVDVKSDAPAADPQAAVDAAKALFTRVKGTHS